VTLQRARAAWSPGATDGTVALVVAPGHAAQVVRRKSTCRRRVEMDRGWFNVAVRFRAGR
jgi:hypothetical protein